MESFEDTAAKASTSRRTSAIASRRRGLSSAAGGTPASAAEIKKRAGAIVQSPSVCVRFSSSAASLAPAVCARLCFQEIIFILGHWLIEGTNAAVQTKMA